MAKEVVFKFKIEVDGKQIEQSINSIDGFRQRIAELQAKLNAAPIGSEQFKKLQAELKKTEGAFDSAKAKNQSFLDNLASAPGILGTLGQSIQGAQKIFSSFNNVLKFSFFGLLATLITKVVEKLSQMEGVMDPLTKLSEIFSGVIGKLANIVMKPLIFIIEGVVAGFEALANIFGSLTGAGEDYGDVIGQISEGLDALDDSQAAFNLQLQKSNRALQEAREIAQDESKSIEERKKALQDAGDLERKIAKENKERTLERARLNAQQIANDLGYNTQKIKAIQNYTQAELEEFAKQASGAKAANREKIDALYGYIGEVEQIAADEAKIGLKIQKGQKSLDDQAEADRKAKAQAAAQAAKERRQQQIADIDAEIKLITSFQDASVKKDEAYYTDLETKLKNYYDKKNKLEDKDNKLTQAQRDVRNKEQTQQIEAFLKQDKDMRKKYAEDQVKKSSEDFQKVLKLEIDKNQKILDESTLFYEKQKLKYGEDSKEAIAAAKEKNDAQLKLLTDEFNALTLRRDQGKELTEAEIKRLGDLTKAIAQFGLFQDQEAQKDIDRETKKGIQMNLLKMKELEDLINSQYVGLEQKQALLDEENKLLEENYQKQLIAAGENAEKKAEIERNYTETLKSQADKRTKIEIDSINAKAKINLQYIETIGQFGAFLSKIAGKNKGIAIAGIVIEQGAALAKVLINRSTAISAANAAAAPLLANPFTAPAAAASLSATIINTNIQAAIAAAGIIAGAAQGIAAVNKAETSESGGGDLQARKLAKGGMVSNKKSKTFTSGGNVKGPGTSTSDSIPAMLSNGESVINAKSTEMFTPLLSEINQAGGGVPFENGGKITPEQKTNVEKLLTKETNNFKEGGKVSNNTTKQTIYDKLKQFVKGGLIEKNTSIFEKNSTSKFEKGGIINLTKTDKIKLFTPIQNKMSEINNINKFQFGGIATTDRMNIEQTTTELATTLGETQTTPIKTYVVAQDVSDMQSFERAQKSRSTL